MSDERWPDVDAHDEAAIRKDERNRLADLLEEHTSILSSFTGGPPSSVFVSGPTASTALQTVRLIVFLIRLDHG